MKRALMLFAFLLVASCANNNIFRNDYGIDWDRKPPADFPHLKIIERLVDHKEVLFQCGTKQDSVIGCAIPNYDWMNCTIYIDKHTDVRRAEIHENAHCRGYDHHGESQIRDGWEKWKKANGYK